MSGSSGQSQSAAGTVLAVDPGTEKCGLAVVQSDGTVLHHEVLPVANLASVAAERAQRHAVQRVVVGDRTGAREIRDALSAQLALPIFLVDEHRSSEQGRRRYFRDNPPRGWRRLLPVGLQTPPRPYDDYVAIVLAERHLASLGTP